MTTDYYNHYISTDCPRTACRRRSAAAGPEEFLPWRYERMKDDSNEKQNGGRLIIIIITSALTVLELLAGEDQPLLAPGGNSFPVLDLEPVMMITVFDDDDDNDDNDDDNDDD